MATHEIEPGQRLRTQVGGQTRFVQVLAEAVVPAGYWLCREEASGQSRVIAQTALEPIAVEPVVVEPVAVGSVAVGSVAVGSVAVGSVAAGSAVVEPVSQAEPLPVAAAVTVQPAITAAA